MTDEYDDRQFQKVVTEGLVPKIEGSAYCVSICPSPDKIDAKFCTELGVMIMLDKPIMAVIEPGGTLPRKLEMVADKIIWADLGTEEGRELIREAIEDIHKEFE